MSGTDQLACELALLLRPDWERRGFKFVKTLRSFRRKSPHGNDLVGLDVTRAHNGSYILAFNFQVLHKELEKVLVTFGPHANATVYQNSYNVHPNRPINYSGPTFWNEAAPIDWAKLLPEITQFLDAVVLPWLDKFGVRENLRNSLAADDGWVISRRPWEIVAAIDILAGREDDLIAYLSDQQKISRNWVPSRATEFGSFVELISARLSAGRPG